MAGVCLSPGPIFNQPGLNDFTLPVDRDATSSDIQEKYAKAAFKEDKPWPPDSPQAGHYDVRNSTTQMILINNRTSAKRNRLRGYAPSEGRQSEPESDRHFPGISPHKNNSRHEPCFSNVSPRFPSPAPRRKQRPPWNDHPNSSHASSDTRSSASKHLRENGVNYGMVLDSPYYSPVYCPYQFVGQPKPRRSPSRSVPSPIRKVFPFMARKGFSTSDRRYLLSLASIYSVRQMKTLKQEQYKDLLFQQYERGFHTAEEYERYMTYINGPRKRQFEKTEGSESARHRTSSGSLLNRRHEKDDSRPTTARSDDGKHTDRRDNPPRSRKEAWANGSESDRQTKPCKPPREKQREVIQKEAQKKRHAWLQKPLNESKDDGRGNSSEVKGKDTSRKEKPIKKDERQGDTKEKQTIKDSEKKPKKTKSKQTVLAVSVPLGRPSKTSNEDNSNQPDKDETKSDKEGEDRKENTDKEDPAEIEQIIRETQHTSQESSIDTETKDKDSVSTDNDPEKEVPNSAEITLEESRSTHSQQGNENEVRTSISEQKVGEESDQPSHQEEEVRIDETSSSEKDEDVVKDKADDKLEEFNPTEEGEIKETDPISPQEVVEEITHVQEQKSNKDDEEQLEGTKNKEEEEAQSPDPVTDDKNVKGIEDTNITNDRAEEPYQNAEQINEDNKEADSIQIPVPVEDHKSSHSSPLLKDEDQSEVSVEEKSKDQESGDDEQAIVDKEEEGDENVMPGGETVSEKAEEIASTIKQDEPINDTNNKNENSDQEEEKVIDNNTYATVEENHPTDDNEEVVDVTTIDEVETKGSSELVKPVATVQPNDEASLKGELNVEKEDLHGEEENVNDETDQSEYPVEKVVFQRSESATDIVKENESDRTLAETDNNVTLERSQQPDQVSESPEGVATEKTEAELESGEILLSGAEGKENSVGQSLNEMNEGTNTERQESLGNEGTSEIVEASEQDETNNDTKDDELSENILKTDSQSPTTKVPPMSDEPDTSKITIEDESSESDDADRSSKNEGNTSAPVTISQEVMQSENTQDQDFANDTNDSRGNLETSVNENLGDTESNQTISSEIGTASDDTGVTDTAQSEDHSKNEKISEEAKIVPGSSDVNSQEADVTQDQHEEQSGKESLEQPEILDVSDTDQSVPELSHQDKVDESDTAEVSGDVQLDPVDDNDDAAKEVSLILEQPEEQVDKENSDENVNNTFEANAEIATETDVANDKTSVTDSEAKTTEEADNPSVEATSAPNIPAIEVSHVMSPGIEKDDSSEPPNDDSDKPEQPDPKMNDTSTEGPVLAEASNNDETASNSDAKEDKEDMTSGLVAETVDVNGDNRDSISGDELNDDVNKKNDESSSAIETEIPAEDIAQKITKENSGSDPSDLESENKKTDDIIQKETEGAEDTIEGSAHGEIVPETGASVLDPSKDKEVTPEHENDDESIPAKTESPMPEPFEGQSSSIENETETANSKDLEDGKVGDLETPSIEQPNPEPNDEGEEKSGEQELSTQMEESKSQVTVELPEQESEKSKEQVSNSSKVSIRSFEREPAEEILTNDEKEEDNKQTTKRPSSASSLSSNDSHHSPRPPKSPREGSTRPRSRFGRPSSVAADEKQEEELPKDI